MQGATPVISVVSPFKSNLTAVNAPAGTPPQTSTTADIHSADHVNIRSQGEAVASGSVTSPAAEAVSKSGLSGAKAGGAAIMAGVALLGAGLMAPATAEAAPHFARFEHSQMMHARWGGGREGFEGGGFRGGFGRGLGFGLGAGLAAGIIGGIVASHAPVYAPPVYVNPGYNAVGCDGVVHHFDPYGNVSDQSGNYRLGVNQFGQCVSYPPAY